MTAIEQKPERAEKDRSGINHLKVNCDKKSMYTVHLKQPVKTNKTKKK